MFDHAHKTIENKTNAANHQDGKDDMRQVQIVPGVPGEEADSHTTSEHLRSHNHKPRNPKTNPQASHMVLRKHGRRVMVFASPHASFEE